LDTNGLLASAVRHVCTDAGTGAIGGHQDVSVVSCSISKGHGCSAILSPADGLLVSGLLVSIQSCLDAGGLSAYVRSVWTDAGTGVIDSY
jgi:hypothetical protein